MKYILLSSMILLVSCVSIEIDEVFDTKYSNEITLQELKELKIKFSLRNKEECKFTNFKLPHIINGRYFYSLILLNEFNGLNTPIQAIYDHGVHKGYFCVPNKVMSGTKIYIQYNNLRHQKESSKVYTINFEDLAGEP